MDRVLPPRRALLAGGITATAAALAGCSRETVSVVATAASSQPRPTTPKAAYARLIEGNKRWVSGNLQHPNRDPTFRQSVAQKQEPFAVILSCIDSRVPPELVFDTGLGDLFVMRTGAQTVGPVVIGSVEYGPVTSGTPLIMVLAHQRCGAVSAAYTAIRDGKPLPGNLQAIADALRPAYQQAAKQATERPETDQIEIMSQDQAKLTADALRANPDLAPMVGKGALAVVSAYYSLDTGRIQVLSGAPS